MADETTQTGEETSWWDLDIFADSDLPSTSLDEPLEWPETLDWGEFSAAEGDLEFPSTGDLESDPIFPPTFDLELPGASDQEPVRAADTEWQAGGDEGDITMPHVTVLSGLGGGGVPAVKAAEHSPHEHLPDSLWAGKAAGSNGNGNGVTPVVATTTAAPTFYGEADQGAGGWRRRFDIRHGNAAVIALISFVSLILLGMFMSVRARNQTPDTSQTRTTSDQIQVQGTLNTVPLTTTVTTTPPAINIADLIPPPEEPPATTAGASAGGGSAGGGSTGGSGGSAPATTAAPARSTPTGGATGTTQPAAQPTNTTAAPPPTEPPETTTPPATAAPATQTTSPPPPRRTTPTFPSLTSTVPSDGTPTTPSFPGFPSIPGFPNNN